MHVEMRNVSKSYGHVKAIEDVNFEVRPGEVMALVGDNGAGKSTLIKILSGRYKPDAGSIYVDGKPVQFESTSDARAHGIETLYQDLSVVPQLSVAQNFFLGREVRSPLGFLRYAEMTRRAKEIIDQYSVRQVDVSQPVMNLSGGQRQIVAMARAVGFGGRTIVLDEPTSALSPRAAMEVLDVVRTLAEQGLGVVIITHQIKQIFDIAHRLTVLRHGRVAGVLDTATATGDEVVKLMVGLDDSIAA
ncbi:ATP-binding cassette domain-containing protein [Georgenia daeguensis]|uniref:ATP-binding cassette domain-containing protein n=1 Tax=Georgenia daeguensis TaxID=908355 RepID=A0ABP8EYL5_9MICO